MLSRPLPQMEGDQWGGTELGTAEPRSEQEWRRQGVGCNDEFRMTNDDGAG